MKIPETKRWIVQLDHVSKIFGANEHKTAAVRNISLTASLGELLVLLGPSGSGKTTLLTLIAGLLKPTSGHMSIFGRNIDLYPPKDLQALRARQIGFVFQTFLLIDSLTVIENAALVLQFTGKPKSDSQDHARRFLKQCQIEHLAQKLPVTLSQGEKQRVAVARALSNNPDLIIADEPTGSLETKQGLHIIRLLHEYAKELDRCVIVASHDIRIAELADRVLRMEDGALLDTCK